LVQVRAVVRVGQATAVALATTIATDSSFPDLGQSNMAVSVEKAIF
jgi:hypothetical protein